MALPQRLAASWTALLRGRSTATLRAAYVRQAGRQAKGRGYASGGGGAVKKSDLPWFLGSVAVTVPTLWYIGIWKPDPNAHHDHDEHEGHEEGGEAHDGSAEQGGESEDQQNEDSSGGEEKNDGKPDDAKVDEAGPSKEPKSQNQMSGKQEGVANADTKHSTDPANDPGKSDKPEGGADTAKAKGTIDTTREQK